MFCYNHSVRFFYKQCEVEICTFKTKHHLLSTGYVVFCSIHATVILHLRDAALSGGKSCRIEGFHGTDCRPFWLPENRTSQKYLEIEDAYARLTLCNASVEVVRYRPMCASHRRIIFCANADKIEQYLPSGTVVTASLECRSMRDTILWVRKTLCGSESVGETSVLFRRDVCGYYIEKCHSYESKRKQKTTFLKHVMPVLTLYRVFMKTSHELGRGRYFSVTRARKV